ncbi:MAG TPA: NYN domain-containing protein [Candidatus Saccharimonadia bacterium]|nr:NYN domain-containing protein [Candidatus Saccharimonadia bacterium]
MKNSNLITYIYVDASNLYGGITELLPNGSYIDFTSILKCIEEDFPVHKIKIYGTYLPDDSSSQPTRQLFIKAQHQFFQSMKNIKKVEFYKGYFSSTSKKEKGIDVKIAVDMLKDAYEGDFKQAIIITGDDDFLYSIQCVKKMKIPVHLVAFASRFPYGISHNVNRRFVYDLNGYFKKKVLPAYKRPPLNLEIKDITKKVKIISV